MLVSPNTKVNFEMKAGEVKSMMHHSQMPQMSDQTGLSQIWRERYEELRQQYEGYRNQSQIELEGASNRIGFLQE